MPFYRDEAVILRTQKLGEADRIVTALTRFHGKARAVAKGVRRTASKFGCRLEPFMVADIQLHTGRSLDIITQAESLGAYGAHIVNDYTRYTAANVMVEMADRVTEYENSQQHYLLLVGGLRALSHAEQEPAAIRDSYVLRSLSLAGWAPSLAYCARCEKPGSYEVFLVQGGGVVCEKCAPNGAPRCDRETIDLLVALVAGEWKTVECAKQSARMNASGLIAAYTQWHLERGLRSLLHVPRTEVELGKTKHTSMVEL